MSEVLHNIGVEPGPWCQLCGNYLYRPAPRHDISPRLGGRGVREHHQVVNIHQLEDTSYNMELKVWVEGIQRIVCGVTEKTTCQVIEINTPV